MSVISSSPRGEGFSVGGDLHHVIVIKIQPGDSDVRLWAGRAFPRSTTRRGRGVELDHAVLFRRADHVSEHGRAFARALARDQEIDRPWPWKMLSPRTSATGSLLDEVGTDDEGVGKPARLVLLAHIQIAGRDPSRRPAGA